METPNFTLDDLNKSLEFYPLWKRGIQGEGITVAVLDTGVNHIPDLGDSVAFERDFTGEGSPVDKAEHGTAMARCVHAVAPKAKIASMKVIPNNRGPDRETVCRAIQYCIDNYPKYRIINLSIWFYPEIRDCILCSKIDESADKGIFVIAVAGNLGPGPGTITCPGSAKKAFTIGATWSREEAEWFRDLSWGKKKYLEITGEFDKRYGTSYSAAYISGGVALLLSACREASVEEIKAALSGTAKKLPDAPDNAQGAGMANLSRALTWLLPQERLDYTEAKRTLYFNKGNKEAQRPDNSYLISALKCVISIVKELMERKRYTTATAELEEIQGCLIPGALPVYEQEINRLRTQCTQQPNDG